MIIERFMITRNLLFLLFNIIWLIIFYNPLKELVIFSLNDELYDYILLVPFVSLYFIFSKYKTIFVNIKYSFAAGSILIALGIIIYLLGTSQQISSDYNNFLFVTTPSYIIFFTGGFVFFYGTEVFRKALFPILFLIFMIPIPTFILDKIIYFLQIYTADISYAFLKLIGVPVFRDGLIFNLPNVSVEVAKQCSGIHSSMATLMIGVLLGQIYLKSWWRKIIMIIAIIPLVILKNGMRVVTLTLLGNYIDITFLTNSYLHKSGGIFFFIPIVVLLTLILWILVKSEKSSIKISTSSKYK